jgi:hypothetical protein
MAEVAHRARLRQREGAAELRAERRQRPRLRRGGIGHLVRHLREGAPAVPLAAGLAGRLEGGEVLVVQAAAGHGAGSSGLAR